MKKTLLLLTGLLLAHVSFSQFHTMKIPQSSNAVSETQRLGVTDITITYHSPATRGREVWSNTDIIPQNGNPIPWRAGANMNTTIEFSTDVIIEGKALAAGKYGFHIIPNGNSHSLLFAHSNNQWGSYYLDTDKDVTLKVEVQDTVCAYSEKLDYEFLPKSANAMTIGLEWGEKRIPFTVSVDLNKTVVESFRSELLGINTYHWQAWNDAANWCLQHNTNLEEALEWATRSIEGGYGGFAADKNITNLTTKARILKALGRKEALTATVKEASGIIETAMDANALIIMLMEPESFDQAIVVSEEAMKKFPDTWFLHLNYGISNYFVGKQKQAEKNMEKAIAGAPDQYAERLNQMLSEIKAGTFSMPERG